MLLRSATDELHIVRGREQVLLQSRALAGLCDRCDQPAAFENLSYQFSLPAYRNRRPTMVVIQSRTPQGKVPVAAVLVYEYQLLRVGTGIYAADFHGGARAVIAPRHLRPRATFAAAEALLSSGALLTHLSYEGDDSAEQLAFLAGPANRWATRTRCGTHYLTVHPDLETTLNQLGRRTRRNLRYYQRMVQSELGARLVLNPTLSQHEFLAFDAACDYPVPPARARERFRKLHDTPQPLFFGLQAQTGEWLSFIGGRFKGPDAVIEWQLNRSDLRQYSLCTAMRAFFLQHAAEQAWRRVYFVGGTTHSMGSALLPETVVDVVVTRAGVPRALINRIAAATDDLPAYQGLIPELVRYGNAHPPAAASSASHAELKSA